MRFQTKPVTCARDENENPITLSIHAEYGLGFDSGRKPAKFFPAQVFSLYFHARYKVNEYSLLNL